MTSETKRKQGEEENFSDTISDLKDITEYAGVAFVVILIRKDHLTSLCLICEMVPHSVA